MQNTGMEILRRSRHNDNPDPATEVKVGKSVKESETELEQNTQYGKNQRAGLDK